MLPCKHAFSPLALGWTVGALVLAAATIASAVPLPKAKTKTALSSRLQFNSIFTRWMKEEAVYEPHWSYIAPKSPALSVVKNTAWARNPIDRFTKPEPQPERGTKRFSSVW